jgi:TetR/AcrR family transcriptional regulator
MTTKERIFDAAIQVFAKKGKHGAKMEEIAATARINKAMIYYIFESKDNLYAEVIKMILAKLNTRMNESLENDVLREKNPDRMLARAIECECETFFSLPNYTRIIFEAMSSHPEEIRGAIASLRDSVHKRPKDLIKKFISAGISEGTFRDIAPETLLGSVFGINMIFFMSKSFGDILDIDTTDDAEHLANNKRKIADLVMNGVMLKK